MYKSNINFIEGLFSDEIMFESKFVKELEQIHDMRADIARMNLPYLFEACRGMHIQKMAMLEKGTEGTKILVDKYGYDTKQALHAVRVLDFLQKYHDMSFTNFKVAITYGYGTDDRDEMLSIKDGKYSLSDFKKYAEEKFHSILELKDKYRSQLVNQETNEKLKEIVKTIVKKNLEL